MYIAWIGHIDEINTEEPLEYFSKEFSTVAKAKRLINHDACILWDEGDWQGEYLSISFKSNSKIFDSAKKKFLNAESLLKEKSTLV